MPLERNLCFSIQLSVMIYFEIWVTVERVVLNRSLCQFITMLLHPRKKKSLSTYLKIHWTSLKLRCMHITNRCHLFYSLQWLWQRIHRTTKRQCGTRLKEHQKAVFLCKKENSALSEHTCLTNHTIGWDNSKIITTNRRYHQRLCLEAWHINSAHAPLNRDDGGLLPDAYLHLVRKKAAN